MDFLFSPAFGIRFGIRVSKNKRISKLITIFYRIFANRGNEPVYISSIVRRGGLRRDNTLESPGKRGAFAGG